MDRPWAPAQTAPSGPRAARLVLRLLFVSSTSTSLPLARSGPLPRARSLPQEVSDARQARPLTIAEYLCALADADGHIDRAVRRLGAREFVNEVLARPSMSAFHPVLT